MAASRSRRSAARETTPRHVWLAGLGLLAVTGREALATPARVAAGAHELKSRATRLAGAVRSRVQGEVEPKVVKFSGEVEARLAPVLEKLGLRKPHRQARKTRAAVKPQPRRGTRQPEKRRTRRA